MNSFNYIKNFKTFESSDSYATVINSKVGDILPESLIYQYVQKLHLNEEDFWDGDLGDRIENYTSYKLMEVDINKIDISDFEIDDDKVDEYSNSYKELNVCPPIVLESEYYGRYTIIDGTHRANALHNNGIDKILAWVGMSV